MFQLCRLRHQHQDPHQQFQLSQIMHDYDEPYGICGEDDDDVVVTDEILESHDELWNFLSSLSHSLPLLLFSYRSDSLSLNLFFLTHPPTPCQLASQK